MDKATIYQLMASKWLETAERVEHRSLKRCYAKRALSYQAMAAIHARNAALQAMPLDVAVPPRKPPLM
jgi:hypothetical protein